MYILFTHFALAGNDPYVLPITRKNVTHKMVAAPWWGGEYPSPIIDVTSKEGETVKIQAHASLRKLTAPTKSCTINTGVFHPWSKSHDVQVFYTISRWVQYHVLVDIPEEGFKRGDTLENETYASEGYCNYIHVSGKTKKDVQLFCDSTRTTAYKKIEHSAHPEEQWLYLKCKEGYKVFILDSDLSKQTGNVSGKMCGYDTVTSSTGTCSAETP